VPAHRLLLIRHAEAAVGPVDAERPLTERGARHAGAVGAWLAEAGLVPDRVLVSPARRAVQTWEEASARLPTRLRPTVDQRVHDNTVEALLAAVGDVPEDTPTLAVVGHNPSLGELAGLLDDGRGDAEARRRVGAGLPAGGVVVLTLGTPFADSAPGSATLVDVAVPGERIT
jgi:phosphohistidine phosphatase